MVHRRHDRPECCTVTLQLVDNQAKRNPPLTSQEFAKGALLCTTVASRLDEDVDQVAVLIDSTPQIVPLTVDRDEHFVQEPGIAESTLPSSQSPSVVWPELYAPAADCLVGDHNSSLRQQQILGISQADTKSVVEPDCVTDDLGRESVSAVARSHLVSLTPGALT